MKGASPHSLLNSWAAHFRNHRLGRAPLWFSVFVILLGGRLLSFLCLGLIPITTPGPVVLAVILCDTIIIGWQLAGVLRTAKRYIMNYGHLMPVWGAYAMIPVAIFMYVFGSFDLLSAGLQKRDYIAEKIPSLEVVDGVALIDGDIGFEQFYALEQLLKTRDINGLELNSYGGRIYAARAIAKLITDNNLTTHVESICTSACTLIFVAADRRTLSDTGVLGFHGYQQLDHIKTLEIETEETRDKSYMIYRGVSEGFAKAAYDVPPEEMWFPDRSILIAAGVVTAN